MRDILNLIIVLTIICTIAAISLAKVYEITKEPIEHQLQLERLRAIEAVLPDFDNKPDKDVKKVVIGKDRYGKDKSLDFCMGYKDHNLIGSAVKVKGMGFGGDIDLMIGIGPTGEILGVEILGHKETPGLGAKITLSNFKDQFKGMSLANTKWFVKKDGGDIDQITGATNSPRAVTKAIKETLQIYKKIDQESNDLKNE